MFFKKDKYEYVTEILDAERLTLKIVTTNNREYDISFEDYANDDFVGNSGLLYDYSHRPIVRAREQIRIGHLNTMFQILTNCGTYVKTQFIESVKITNVEKIKLERVKAIKI